MAVQNIRSCLALVSESFEGGASTLSGMLKGEITRQGPGCLPTRMFGWPLSTTKLP